MGNPSAQGGSFQCTRETRGRRRGGSEGMGRDLQILEWIGQPNVLARRGHMREDKEKYEKKKKGKKRERKTGGNKGQQIKQNAF